MNISNKAIYPEFGTVGDHKTAYKLPFRYKTGLMYYLVNFQTNVSQTVRGGILIDLSKFFVRALHWFMAYLMEPLFIPIQN
jgi:hypothetical protein